MPNFDLRGIKIAAYSATGTTVTYTNPQTIGDAMNVNIGLTFAEGRLYAESALAEFIREATGGTISIGIKYIPDAAKKLLFGFEEKSRTVSSKQIKGLQATATSAPSYVGVAFYAPDMIDGNRKFTCVFCHRALFGPPDMAFQTKGNSIEFNTPTTTGEFLPDHSAGKVLFETAICDTEADAKAWITEVLK